MAHDLSYLLVDGENIDVTLGNSILGGRPNPEQRPRWDRVRDFTTRLWSAPCKPLFFLNASSGVLPTSFIQALLALNYRPIPLSGPQDGSVVDVAILRTLEALRERPGNVLLASHDGDFLSAIESLLAGDRRVGVLGFREFVSASYRELTARGLEIHDLETEAHAFNVPLPRVRIIPVDEFDPADFL
ncbi:MAG: nuclease [Planctomycetes bacterium]|nr:nuclease [Planctomycetota bacterium]